MLVDIRQYYAIIILSKIIGPRSIDLNKTILLGLCLILFIMTGCGPTTTKQSRFLLNTVVEITVYGRKSEKLINELFQEMQYMENKYSRYIADSEIYNVNSNPGIPVPVSEDTFDLIQQGIYYATISDGLFDISIGPLVDLWAIGEQNPQIPLQSDIDLAKSRVDYRNISMDSQNHTISVAEGMSIDTGAIAKGFITDKLVYILQEGNADSALLNLGGNLYLYSSKPDGSLWTVGIRDPFGSQGDYLGTISVRDMSVVTSGIYERYFEVDQKRFHHILNPETGYPADNELASISIISPSSTKCDGLSTTCFLLGLDKGMELIEQLEDVETIMVTKDKKVYVSNGIKNGAIHFKLTNDEYTLINK